MFPNCRVCSLSTKYLYNSSTFTSPNPFVSAPSIISTPSSTRLDLTSRDFLKRVFLSVHYCASHQNAKKQRKHFIWENNLTLPKKKKNVYFEFFHIIKYQNAEIHANPSMVENETTLQKTYLLSAIVHVSNQNTTKLEKYSI